MSDRENITGLDADEMEMIARLRKERKNNDDRRVRIRDGEKEAEIPWGEAVGWRKKNLGIGVDGETGEPVTKDDEEAKDDPPKTRFAGRRVS